LRHLALLLYVGSDSNLSEQLKNESSNSFNMLSSLAYRGICGLFVKSNRLERICSSSSEDDLTVCSLIVEAYKDGFIEGIANGVMGAYRYDSEIHATVKNVKAKDFAPSFNKVVAQSTCIQNVQVDVLANAFYAYVKLNSSLQKGPYRTAMFRMIEAKYCKKRATSSI
jgi:hypothetical protein